MLDLPHDRRALIYLNALEEAHSKISSYKSDKEKGFIDVNSYLLSLEDKPKKSNSIDEQLADLGMKLSHAVIEDRHEDMERFRAEYLNISSNHPDSEILNNVPNLIEEHSVSGYDYRNWKGTTEGQDFGVIKAKLNDNATIGIIGDWGTGNGDAQALLQELKDNHNPDVIIHLGDIYSTCRYSEDVLPNFIDIIDNVYPPVNGKPSRPPILTIPGNHDYMSRGGKGFFKLLDTVNAHHPLWKQEASYFCLRTQSEKWQFLGADTGINDPSFHPRNEHPGLEPDEYAWHYDKMKKFKSKGKGRTIFMTHHPLFSATHRLQNGEYLNQDLANNFKGYLTNGSVQSGEIRLWLWGHNHWFLPYVPSAVKTSTLDKGRLIGGSARHDRHSSSEIATSGKHVIQYQKNGQTVPLIPDANNGLPNHTYAVIKLSDSDAEISHFQKPSWHDWNNNSVKTLPSQQNKVLLREYVLDTKPTQKYVAH